MTPAEISNAGIEMFQLIARARPSSPPKGDGDHRQHEHAQGNAAHRVAFKAACLLRKRAQDLERAQGYEEQREDFAGSEHSRFPASTSQRPNIEERASRRNGTLVQRADSPYLDSKP